MFISIEGNIGAGKSTLLAYLKTVGGKLGGKKVIFVPEPVDSWEQIKSEKGENMIELFYSDQTKYSFAFQIMAFVSRYRLLETAVLENPDAVIIAERSLCADKIFATMLFDGGQMSQVEHTIYMQLFECFNRLPAEGVIYLKCLPETAKARCEKRNRPGEVIPLEYLEKCHAYHEKWIKGTDALVLDAELSVSDHIDKINEFIEGI
jgi:deoxyadenosine/deoxycytidine kinase